MLRILYWACAAAYNAFRTAGNPVDEQLVIDLEMMVTRTSAEIERLEASGTPTADYWEETVTGGSTAAR